MKKLLLIVCMTSLSACSPKSHKGSTDIKATGAPEKPVASEETPAVSPTKVVLLKCSESENDHAVGVLTDVEIYKDQKDNTEVFGVSTVIRQINIDDPVEGEAPVVHQSEAIFEADPNSKIDNEYLIINTENLTDGQMVSGLTISMHNNELERLQLTPVEGITLTEKNLKCERVKPTELMEDPSYEAEVARAMSQSASKDTTVEQTPPTSIRHPFF